MIKCWKEGQTTICFRKFLIFSLYSPPPPPPPPHPKYCEKNSSRTYQMCYPFSLALRLRRICTNNETFILRTNELIDYLYKRGYNRYLLHGKYNELTISQGQFHTGQTRTCSLRYHLQHSPSFHLIHYSQTFSHPYFISPLPIDVVATSAIF